MTFSKNHKRISESMSDTETMIQERKEALQADARAKTQREQYYKRIGIPYCSKYFFLFLVLLFSHGLAFFVGFLSGQASMTHTEAVCTRIVEEKVIFKCLLPPTGADVKPTKQNIRPPRVTNF